MADPPSAAPERHQDTAPAPLASAETTNPESEPQPDPAPVVSPPETANRTAATDRGDQPPVIAMEESRVQRDDQSAPPTAPAPSINRPLAQSNAKPEPDPSLAAQPEVNSKNEAPRRPAPMDPDRLIARGDKLFSLGDLGSARLVYGMAVTSGSGRAAQFIGRTYDPLYLKTAGLDGIQANATLAAEWYGKAEAMGDEEAARRVDELRAWLEERATQGDTDAIRTLESLR